MKNIDPVRGFTLLELAIVVVIIGLVAGGILVGQDMIKASEARGTLSQVEKFQTAAGAFQNKYGAMPGDLPSATASKYGFVTRTGAAGHGDGDGTLESCADGIFTSVTVAGCETTLFWRDLSDAGLINESFTAATDAVVQVSSGSQKNYWPLAKLGRGNYLVPFYSGQPPYNNFGLTAVTSTDASGLYTLDMKLTPGELYSMDIKMDDGLPLSGALRARYSTSNLDLAPTPAAPAPGVCVSNAISTNPYNTATSANANTPACQAKFRFAR